MKLSLIAIRFLPVDLIASQALYLAFRLSFKDFNFNDVKLHHPHLIHCFQFCLDVSSRNLRPSEARLSFRFFKPFLQQAFPSSPFFSCSLSPASDNFPQSALLESFWTTSILKFLYSSRTSSSREHKSFHYHDWAY